MLSPKRAAIEIRSGRADDAALIVAAADAGACGRARADPALFAGGRAAAARLKLAAAASHLLIPPGGGGRDGRVRVSVVADLSRVTRK